MEFKMSEVFVGYQVVERSDDHCIKWSEETGRLVYLFEEQEYEIGVVALECMQLWTYCVGTLRETVNNALTILFRVSLVDGFWEPGKKLVLFPNCGSASLEGLWPYLCLTENVKEIAS